MIPFTTAILLAGGIGKRMGAAIPKQFLELAGKPIIRHSFDLFCSTPAIHEIIIVCEPHYWGLFVPPSSQISVRFALPGKERQESLYHGFQQIDPSSTLTLIHDSARPFLIPSLLSTVLQAGWEEGAAVLALPAKQTIKQCDPSGFVTHTLDRSQLWEMQTPQVIRTDLLRKGIAHAQTHQLRVTDDVALVEAIGHPVKIVPGHPFNIKMTTQEDYLLSRPIYDLIKNQLC